MMYITEAAKPHSLVIKNKVFGGKLTWLEFCLCHIPTMLLFISSDDIGFLICKMWTIILAYRAIVIVKGNNGMVLDKW